MSDSGMPSPSSGDGLKNLLDNVMIVCGFLMLGLMGVAALEIVAGAQKTAQSCAYGIIVSAVVAGFAGEIRRHL